MNRKIIWGVPIALAVMGLLLLLAAHLQPSVAATVTAVVEKYYTPAKKLARGHTSAHYRAVLAVEYTDWRGEKATAEVQYRTTHPFSIPKAGDEVRICRSLTGMAIHPNRTLVAVGGTAAIIGGLFLLMFGLTRLSMRRKR